MKIPSESSFTSSANLLAAMLFSEKVATYVTISVSILQQGPSSARSVTSSSLKAATWVAIWRMFTGRPAKLPRIPLSNPRLRLRPSKSPAILSHRTKRVAKAQTERSFISLSYSKDALKLFRSLLKIPKFILSMLKLRSTSSLWPGVENLRSKKFSFLDMDSGERKFVLNVEIMFFTCG